MKTPLLNQIERKIMIGHPNAPTTQKYNLFLARKKFEREFVNSLYIPQIVEWLNKQLNKLN